MDITIERLEFKDGSIAIHRFKKEDSSFPPVLLIHGSIENSGIFFSKSGKGLAPFLVSHGFEVFVPDLRGRGESKPSISRKIRFSQAETIKEELPAIVKKVLELSGAESIHLGAHSWGGVLLLSTYALFREQLNVKSMVLFGSKKYIGIKSLLRFLRIELGWIGLGGFLSTIYGYFPAKEFGAGSDNEPNPYNRDTMRWVRSKSWVDPETKLDYGKILRSTKIPPSLIYAGVNDKVLGHPKDVKFLTEQAGIPEAFQMLGKKYGNLHDYGHIDMLTHKDAKNDHFPEVAEFFKQNS